MGFEPWLMKLEADAEKERGLQNLINFKKIISKGKEAVKVGKDLNELRKDGVETFKDGKKLFGKNVILLIWNYYK